MEDLSVQEEVEPMVHEKLTNMGFVKQYAIDNSCYWYSITKKDLPIFKEIEITYDVETGDLYLHIELSELSDVEKLLINTFDLDYIEMFLVDCKFIYND